MTVKSRFEDTSCQCAGFEEDTATSKFGHFASDHHSLHVVHVHEGDGFTVRVRVTGSPADYLVASSSPPEHIV